ncbi:15 kda selenoprotein [Globisporangium polare]
MRATTLRTLLAALSAAAVVCADELSATSTIATTRDVDACRALGFDADVLDCRRCDELSTFLSDKLSGDDSNNKKKKKKAMHASQTLDADCRKCCTDLSALDLAAKNAQQYDRVVLEVCTCKFGRYPKVANFVHYHAEKHANLQIEYINARHPFLIFYDAEGNKKEEIGIASWDEETISELIVAKLKSDDNTDAAGPQAEATSAESSDDEDAAAAIDEPLEGVDSGEEEQANDSPEPSQEKENDEL